MLLDTARTQSFLRAILDTVNPGDVVLDLGCGTGILSYFACIAGAKHVYAVEQGPIIELAERICRKNGFQDRVTFIHDWSTNIDLSEKVDVIVTETIGNLGFEEGILAWVIDARNRSLKKTGCIIPSTLEINLVPVESWDDYSKLDSWLGDFYSLNFSTARSINVNNLNWTQLSPESFIAEPASVTKIDLLSVSRPDFSAERFFECQREGLVHGLGGWFTAEVASGVVLSNAPPINANSWSHVFLPLEKPIPVKAGMRLHVQIHIENNAADWKWKVNLEDAEVNNNTIMIASDDWFQSTTLGRLLSSSNSSFLAHKPELNEYGKTDLFILQSMDGNTPIQEITRQVVARFPNQFHDFESALDHINTIVRDYGRWKMGNVKR